MKRILLIIAFLNAGLSATAQFSQNKDNQIVIGVVDSLFSEILNEPREIWIHLPEEIDTVKKYPVIYLLDGPAHFYTVTGILKLVEQWNMPESIVVGIPNTDRIRDYTPTNVAFQRGHKSETSGGAHNFIRFIETELKPYVENNYSTDNISTIIGHSTGGLFVLYAFMHHADVFDNYLAIDPSLWWDDEKLVRQSKTLINREEHQDKSLYVAVANSGKIDTAMVRKDTSEITEQIRANLNFHDILLQSNDFLEFTWDYYEKEDHGSIVTPGIYNGLRALFAWYPFPERWRFNTPEEYTSEELTTPFYTHFEELSKRFKRDIKPKWQFINDVGFFILMAHNLPDKARDYLEMNLKYYPEESRSYIAMGDYYTMRKNKKQAVKYFGIAIELMATKMLWKS